MLCQHCNECHHQSPRRVLGEFLAEVARKELQNAVLEGLNPYFYQDVRPAVMQPVALAQVAVMQCTSLARPPVMQPVTAAQLTVMQQSAVMQPVGLAQLPSTQGFHAAV